MSPGGWQMTCGPSSRRCDAHADTVGILICGSKNDHTVRYSLGRATSLMAVPSIPTTPCPPRSGMTIRTPADALRPGTGQRTRSPGDGYPLPHSANFHATPGESRRRGAAEDPYLACRIRLRSGQQKSPTGVRGDSRTGVSVTVLQLDECGAAWNKLAVWERPLNRRRVASADSPSACPSRTTQGRFSERPVPAGSRTARDPASDAARTRRAFKGPGGQDNCPGGASPFYARHSAKRGTGSKRCTSRYDGPRHSRGPSLIGGMNVQLSLPAVLPG